jgi:alanine racemase
VTTRAFAVDVGDKSRPIIASGVSGRLTDMPRGYEFAGYCCPVAGHPSMDLLPIDVSDLPIPWPLGVRRDGDADWRGDRYAAATRSTGREVLSHLGSRFHRYTI